MADAMLNETSLAYAESFLPEDDITAAARERGRERGLLDGMADDGQLVSIDIESENQRAAKEAFAEAGIAPSRYRLINGSAADVLPRMRDDTYDLVFVDADKSAYSVYYEQAVRMLRPGGIVAFDNALWHDRVADSSQRDTETVVLRELAKAVREDPRLVCAMLPVGDGLLVAAKRP
jgi:predicted O-methyltransferase YrrM